MSKKTLIITVIAIVIIVLGATAAYISLRQEIEGMRLDSEVRKMLQQAKEDFPDAQSRARDAIRMSDVRQLVLQILSYASKYGSLPENLQDLTPALIPVIPKDPLTDLPYQYTISSDRASFTLCAKLEGGGQYCESETF
jgi:hypothetical protein